MSDDKIHITFAYIALIFGVLFIFLTAPFHSPDEDSHFKKAYVLARGDFFPTVEDNVEGYYLPVDMVKYIYDKISKISDREWRYTYQEFYEDNFLAVDYSEQKVFDFATKNALSIAYIPSVIGIVLAKISGRIFLGGTPSVVYMLYFARFFSLLFYTVVTAIAIKKTPVLKKTMSVIALLPMSVFLGSMVTYDNFLIPICFLTVATILNLAYNDEKKFELKHLIFFMIVGFILIRIKTVYFAILLLLFLIPKEKFKDNKKFKYLLLSLLGIIGIYIVTKIPGLLTAKSAGGAVIPNEQVAFIKENPLRAVGIIISNIYSQKSVRLVEMIGILGLIDTYLPRVVILVLMGLLVLVPLSELSLSKIKINRDFKIVGLFIFIATIIGIYTAMYVSWTPQILGAGGTEVTGVQGRYYLPIIILPLMIFSNKKLQENKIIKKIMEFILEYYMLISAIGLMVSALVLLFRFWA